MPNIINALAELDTAEVSLVPRGANRRNRFAMLKENQMNIEQIMKSILGIEAENEEAIDTLAKEGKLSGKAVEAMKGMLRIAQAFKDELPSDAIATLAKLAQLEGGEEKPEGEKPEGEEEPKPEGELAPPPGGEMLKADGTLNIEAVPEALRPTVELLHKQATDDRATIVELRKSLDDETEQRIDRETRELVEKEAPHAPGAEKDKIVALLTKTTDKDDRETLLAVLRAGSETVEKSALLQQVANPGERSGGAWDEIQKIAKSRVEKSDKPVDMAQAITDVMADPTHKHLYDRYIAEQG